MPATLGLHGFVFRGQHSSDYGIIVNSVKRSILAPFTERLVTVPNRDGAYYFGKQMGVREFKVDITIMSDSDSDLSEKILDIAAWLHSDDEEELIFDQEPDKSYYAFLTGNTDLTELVTIGQTTLQFICPDPYKYGPEKTLTLDHTPYPLLVGGREITYPVFKATFHEDSSYLAVATKDQYVHIGSNSAEAVLVPAWTKVIDDAMGSVASWTPQTTVDGGTATGTFTSNGFSFSVSSYGTGSSWHGPALKKMIATPITDFRMDAIVGMYSTQQGQRGRIEIYLLDQNGNVVGKVSLSDSSGYEITTFQARAGNDVSGHYFANYQGSVDVQKKKVKTVKKVKGKNVTTYGTVTEEYSTFRDFYGMLRISRVGNVWDASILKMDTNTGRVISSKGFHFENPDGRYGAPVAGVAIHIGQYGTYAPMSPAYIADLKLINVHQVTTDETPIIFNAGDEVIIDHEEATVYLNGEPFMNYLNLGSQFFGLQGTSLTEIGFAPADKITLEVSTRPRYL